MRRFFGRIENDIAIIDGDEFIHLKTVLRGKIGDDLVVYNGTEKEYICRVKNLNKNSANCDVLEVKICEGLPKKNIVLYQALTKRDKMELILVKAVELGIKEMVPFESEYCTVKPSENKKDRLEKLVLTACKQCERGVPMTVRESIKFKDLEKELVEFKKQSKSIVIFANERQGGNFDYSTLKTMENIAIVIGAEGGFSQEEKDKLSKISESVSLGKRILRSETASIVLCGMACVIGEN